MGIFQRRFRRDVASGEKLNLTMPTTETGSPMVSPSSLQPFTSPPLEDAPIWNILPSYQLYESTFAKVMDPMIEEFNEEPPLYQDSPTHSSSSEAENDYFGRQPGPEASFHTPEPRWENSILANVHRMKYVDEFNKLVADKLIVETVLTKNGRISVNGNDAGSGTKPLLFYKFLNMFDYNASWTPACFEESSTTNLGPIDPVDGTTLQFPFQRQLEPGVAYKKFFNFTIPTKLLDCACETHEIPQHCVLFPSIGLDKNIFLSRLRKLREVPVKTGRTAFPCTPNKTTHSITSNSVSNKRNAPNITTRDYGFSDTSISYSVETKVIGKRSVYDKSAESKMKNSL
ncbi:hypothetical protein JCM33374_g722 [Metschnikowia sp. JCM 33374]|nr:hypothetical protein JCM33374_g722 [Metschnikowia sp. JCM 33374]